MKNITFDGEELIALARLDIEANNLEAALQKIKQGFELKDAPNELNALGAKLYAQLRLFDKAKKLYTRFLESNPNAITEHFQLGMVNFDSGDREQALKIWQKVLEQQPTHPPTLYYSSVVLLAQGDKDAAQRNIDVLIKSAPASNLYFEKAKELLAGINRSDAKNVAPADSELAYSTES